MFRSVGWCFDELFGAKRSRAKRFRFNRLADRRRHRSVRCIASAGTGYAPRFETLETRQVLDSTVVFSELMYHPRENESLEWIEFQNLMSVDMDLSRWSIEGVGYTFPVGTILNAGQSLVVAKDPVLLQTATGVSGALGPYSGQLANGGETLRLRNNSNRIMDELTYGDSGDWPVGPDGSGATLAKRTADGGSSGPANWASSNNLGGTPGSLNAHPVGPSQIILNEVAGASGEFWVELLHRGSGPLPLERYRLATDEPGIPAYVFPSQMIQPGELITIPTSQLGFRPSAGSRLFLYQGDESLADAIDVQTVARGRESATSERWFVSAPATPGTANQFSLEQDIVINEILYHAAPQSAIADRPAVIETQVLVKMDPTAAWRYRDTTPGLPADWANSSHAVNENGWKQGSGVIGYDIDRLPVSIHTTLANPAIVFPAVRTFYFEIDFNVPEGVDPATADLKLQHLIDDGAVFYLNGVEAARFNMPEGPVSAETFAKSTVDNAVRSDSLSLSAATLRSGANRLSVEVHQDTAVSADVVFGAELTLTWQSSPAVPGQPYQESAEEWIELYNRSSSRTVDLSGWRLDEAVDFEFPAGTEMAPGQYLVIARDPVALRSKYPSLTGVLGPFSGQLSNHSERVRLLDQRSNPADEVRYFSTGRWTETADGGGASLELKDAWADNNKPESWAASRPTELTWQTVRYRGVSKSEGFSNGVTNRYHELVMGLLDAGEYLIDDVSVVESPGNANLERIQNGSFESDTIGESAAKWRVLGNHQGIVDVDPQDPANQVLHVRATGSTEDRHNHGETTFADGAKIKDGVEYEISFRAMWLAGSNQLRTNLYWNRLPKTTILSRTDRTGTPGAANSQAVLNTGPTYQRLRHDPVVPAAGEAVRVSIEADDPQSVARMTLYYSVQDGPFQSVPMTRQSDGRYQGEIPGQAASQIVQFYVEGADGANATSQFPAEGAESRALFKVQDNRASSRGLHNFRIIMTPADTRLLHLNTNQLSDRLLGATVIYDEKEVFYNVGARLRGSNAGRSDATYLGFHVGFDPMQLFRGVHDSVAIDRSGRSSLVPNAQDEILIKHIGNQAGDIPLMYDDLVHVIAPNAAHSRTALLMMARYGDEFLDTQYENGSEGTVFRLDIAYVQNTTAGNTPEGIKIGFPYSHPEPTKDLQNLGDDKELYRSHLSIRNNQKQDDYSGIIAASKALGLTGAAQVEAAAKVIDIDEWARVFALQSLVGAVDVYTRGGLHHNIDFFVRPEDDKVLALPWDWDFAFTAPANQSLIGTNSNTGRLLNQPGVRRQVYGHLLDIINTTFNNAYMDRWIDHYGAVAGQNYRPIKAYINSRRNYVTSRLPAAIPFEITTNAGADLSVDSSQAIVQGKGWIDVHEIRLMGASAPLPVRWLDDQTWEVNVGLQSGANRLQFEAINHQGAVVGADEITITSSVSNPLKESLRITEVQYHPADPTPTELAFAAGLESADFEFIELQNTGSVAIDLTNVRFARGVDLVFEPQSLAAGEYAVVVRNLEAFRIRYGNAPRVLGTFTSSTLANQGERIELVTADGATIVDLTYDDQSPWPGEADGAGPSLELIHAAVLPLGETSDGRFWRASVADGSPGRAAEQTLPVPGDLTGNQQLDIADVDLVCYGVRSSDEAFDLNGDDRNDLLDMGYLLETILKTSSGDINLDGRFNSADLIVLFQRGEFEDSTSGNSAWSEGDWNCDGDFTTADLVLAMQAGKYE